MPQTCPVGGMAVKAGYRDSGRDHGRHVPTVRRAHVWDVHEPAKSIIELHDDRFDELVVEVSDPQVTVEQIKAKIQTRPLPPTFSP
jgi:hypothetical protein